MKRRIILSIALTLSVVLLSLTSSDSPANAARPRKFVADTGMITLGPNQMLRVTVVPANDGLPEEIISFTYARITYAEGTCNGGACKHSISSQTTTDPIRLAPGEAASMDTARTPSSSGVRGRVVLLNASLPNAPTVPLKASIIDTDTGKDGGNVEFEWQVEEGVQ